MAVLLPKTLPVAKADNTNLDPIPTGWQFSTNGMAISVGGSDAPNDVWNTTQTYGGAETVQIAPTGFGANSALECDGSAFSAVS